VLQRVLTTARLGWPSLCTLSPEHFQLLADPPGLAPHAIQQLRHVYAHGSIHQHTPIRLHMDRQAQSNAIGLSANFKLDELIAVANGVPLSKHR